MNYFQFLAGKSLYDLQVGLFKEVSFCLPRVDTHGWNCWVVFCMHSKTFEKHENVSKLTTPFCMPISITSNLSQLLTLSILLVLMFPVRPLCGLIYICPNGIGYLFYIVIFNPFSKCLLKSVSFSVGLFPFVIFKTSLCILDLFAFSCIFLLSILYQTMPYVFIWRAEFWWCLAVLLHGSRG